MKRGILFLVFLVWGGSAYSDTVNCGVVAIESVLSGPRHGSMMKVSPACPGTNGWVCLDPDAEHMSAEESKRLYAHILSFHVANKPFELHVSTHLYAAACGANYAVVEDVRTPE